MAPMKLKGLSTQSAEELASDLLKKVGLIDKINEYPGTSYQAGKNKDFV